ncbi:hypothetical protein [Streptomyces sp. NBC_00503]|uniref:hypothetical protein n=1 Tax=Streptomyces sp. NBC_00503 TaxID=2903659 RepID=UPI002E8093B2|nr:hypothetical protein [Streptomyces sp. NBC_00503]WUD81109.1 hypothetical protein OG490_11460 [Streptomyces sp. NBC_00503]
MDWLTPEEECLLVNASEGASLWALLADWTESEDEEAWRGVVPVFLPLVESWVEQGYLEVFRAAEPPAYTGGTQLRGRALEAALRTPSTWEYHEDRTVGLYATPAAAALGTDPAERRDPPRQDRS